MKKVLMTVIGIIIVLSVCFILVACGEAHNDIITIEPQEIIIAPPSNNDEIETHEHTFAIEWEHDSNFHWHSSTCGHDVVSDKAEHNWSKYTMTKAPLCASSGTKERTCVCGEKEVAVIPPLDHNYSETVTEPTCTEQGYTTHVCIRCGVTYVDNYTLGEHRWGDWYYTRQPTCTNKGYRLRKCDSCNMSESDEPPALGHTGSWHIAKKATCTPGKEDCICTRCNQYVVYYTSPSFEHNYDDTNNQCTHCGEFKPTENLFSFYQYDEFTNSQSVCVSNPLRSYIYTNNRQYIYIKRLSIPSSYNGIPVTTVGPSSVSAGTPLLMASVTDLFIPDSITEIQSKAFDYFSQVENISIGSGLISSLDPFTILNNRTTIEVSKKNPKYHSEGNCIIDTENKILVLGGANSIIPTDGSVTSIGADAFYKISYDEKSCAFPLKGLREISIPDSVVSIGPGAFAYCGELTTLYLGEGVTDIDPKAFYRCFNIDSIVVSNANQAYSCNGNCLIEVSTKTLCLTGKGFAIPTDGSVSQIGAHVFSGNDGITSIYIPASIVSIGKDAFYYCSNLKDMYYGGTKDAWYKIHGFDHWDYQLGTNIVHCTDGDVTWYHK